MKLKRRVGVLKETQHTALSEIEETLGEPPLKKFKALFESIDQSPEETTVPTVWTEPPSTSVPTNPKSALGAPPGKPDTDAAFLKAIASTKRGKKHEDNFDREFNKLKISKPELARRDAEDEWGVLADFGNDSGLRGNFMVIVEMDVTEKASPVWRERSTNHQRDGNPNFKKFKKKVAGYQRSKIDLFASQGNSYEIEKSQWKSSQPRAPIRRRFSASQDDRSQVQPVVQMGEDQPAVVAETDDEAVFQGFKGRK